MWEARWLLALNKIIAGDSVDTEILQAELQAMGGRAVGS